MRMIVISGLDLCQMARPSYVSKVAPFFEDIAELTFVFTSGHQLGKQQ